MKTSCFKNYTGEDGVAICLFPPITWNGLQFPALAPSRDMFFAIKAGKIKKAEYEQRYRDEILSKLDPQQVYDTFKNNVLLCFEAPGEFCHRLIVSRWLEEELGIQVPEWKLSDEKKINKNIKPLF